jgi:hypothetical protein
MNYYKDQLDNSTFDIKQTILSNLLWFLLLGMTTLFFTSAIKAIETLRNFEKAMALIFTLFFILKMLNWVGAPNLIYKTKKAHYTPSYST